MFDKFYKHSPQIRRELLESVGRYNATLDQPLSESIYSNMIENSITTYELPFGVVPGFILNQEEFIIPMVTEEPSVIAAQSNAAKIFNQNGGITARVLSRYMRGEIAIPVIDNAFNIMSYVDSHQEALIELANEAYPSIVSRGGGVRNIGYRYIESDQYHSFVIIDVSVDTQEAMGANMINTILEAIKNKVAEELDVDPLMAILSNLADECLVEAKVILDPKTLKNSDVIATKMVLASDLAHVDSYRATTHNKGIMNGIDALVIATGNDFRAVEAGAHAYASRTGKYQSLTRWEINRDGMLVGSIKLPMAIGTVGGTISVHPKAQLAYQILNINDAKTLMQLIAGVGLAQNFAALYALTTDGIQKGHMRMHARSLMLQAGCPEALIEKGVVQLIQTKPMNLAVAKEIVHKLKNPS